MKVVAIVQARMGSTRLPGNSGCSMLIQASLTRSAVGRVSRPGGASMIRLRHFPAMILIQPVASQ